MIKCSLNLSLCDGGMSVLCRCILCVWLSHFSAFFCVSLFHLMIGVKAWMTSLHTKMTSLCLCTGYKVLGYCIVLSCTVLPCTMLYCLILYCIVLSCTILHCTALSCLVLYCLVLHCIVLYCIALYCFVLCCIVLQSNNSFNFPLGWTKYIVVVTVLHCIVLCWLTFTFTVSHTVLSCTVLCCTENRPRCLWLYCVALKTDQGACDCTVLH